MVLMQNSIQPTLWLVSIVYLIASATRDFFIFISKIMVRFTNSTEPKNILKKVTEKIYILSENELSK